MSDHNSRCCVCGKYDPKVKHRISRSATVAHTLLSFNKYTPHLADPVIGQECYEKLRRALVNKEKVVKLPSRVSPGMDCGDGVMALEFLPKGVLATYYGGLPISEAQANAMPIERRSHCRRLVKGIVLDGVSHYRTGPYQGLGSIINEADDPNCQYRESVSSNPTRIEVRTLRDIAIGEELTVFYGRDYPDTNVQGRSKRGRPSKKVRPIERAGFHEKVKRALTRPRKEPKRFTF